MVKETTFVFSLSLVVCILIISSIILPFVSSEACKATKVHAVCESRCEQDTRLIDRVSVPPPGTLLPPTGMSQAADEGNAPQVNIQDKATPADSSDIKAISLLQIELDPAVTITKKKNGEFKPENMAKATYQVQLPKGVSDVQSARMVFPDHDIQNLNEVSASHFGQLDSGLVSQPLSCEDVEAHVSPVQLLSWVDVRKSSFGCVDGRSAEEGLGTWGGDFGEFVTALNIYEQMTTLHLSQQEVTSILRKYLEASTREKFTTCISGLAVKQMFGNVDDMKQAIMNPPEERRAALWMKISDPNFVGNEHIKFMLESSVEYSVRKELVQHIVHSFYDILWNTFDPLRSKLDVQVLPGDHSERAVVSISSPEFCLQESHLVPKIAPRNPENSMAVIHPDAVQFLRRELSVFFSRETNPIVKADEMNKRFNILAAGQGALTKKRMFDRIPTFTAKISE